MKFTEVITSRGGVIAYDKSGPVMGFTQTLFSLYLRDGSGTPLFCISLGTSHGTSLKTSQLATKAGRSLIFISISQSTRTYSVETPTLTLQFTIVTTFYLDS